MKMKLYLLVSVLLAVVVAAPPDMTRQWMEIQPAVQVKQMSQEPSETKLLFESPYKPQWEEFKSKHGKIYESVKEDMRRFGIFIVNLIHIEEHNKLHKQGLKSYTLGVNKYADMSHEEFVKTMNGLQRNYNESKAKPHSVSYLSPNLLQDLPRNVDWRKKGYVTPVKDQGQCGSCWSFSTTGALEGQHKRKTGRLVSLSEQNLVDCSVDWGNHGCNGGLMDQAFKYIKDNGGIDTEESYPYKGVEGKCHFKKRDIGADDSGFVDIPSQDEDKLKEAIATIGPVSVAIDAGHRSFQLYKEGVYDEPDCSSTQLDHGVLAVGYGVNEDGIDYWLVKNSWSAGWGDEGYVKMSRNKDNQCGIATQASYPLV
ncbi:procathepsin L-like [Tubulanus polymorphus]|uniref:procathepsin L-like n=1 Tax=Tubulanus polymorphus TaxID=672921 RepID=UPI003DA27B9F